MERKEISNDLFNSSGNGDPAAFQHLMWLLGHPSTWVTILIWLLILIGFFKLARRLWRARKWVWLAVFMIAAALALCVYIDLSAQAFDMYREGRSDLVQKLRVAKRVIILLGIGSGIWVISDFLKSRRA